MRNFSYNKDLNQIANIYVQIANIYGLIDDYINLNKYYKNAFDVYKKLNDTKKIREIEKILEYYNNTKESLNL